MGLRVNVPLPGPFSYSARVTPRLPRPPRGGGAGAAMFWIAVAMVILILLF